MKKNGNRDCLKKREKNQKKRIRLKGKTTGRPEEVKRRGRKNGSEKKKRSKSANTRNAKATAKERGQRIESETNKSDPTPEEQG